MMQKTIESKFLSVVAEMHHGSGARTTIHSQEELNEVEKIRVRDRSFLVRWHLLLH